MRLIAVVPVRSGSKGLLGKNLRTLAGLPLWLRAVGQGREAGAQEIVVSTDISEILNRPPEPGLKLLKRPAALAGDDVPMAPVMADLLGRGTTGPARIVLLQATSPLRSLKDIRDAIALHATGAFDLVKTVTPTDPGILKYGTMEGDRFRPVSDPAFCFRNRQDLPGVMRPNGAVYVFDRDWYLSNDGFETQSIGAVIMPPERSVDIDTESDFARAEAALS